MVTIETTDTTVAGTPATMVDGSDRPRNERAWGLRIATTATVVITVGLLVLAAVRHDAEGLAGEGLAEGSLHGVHEIRTGPDTRVMTFKLTIHPGATGGWHTHSGPVVVTVVQGAVTEYRGNGASCTRRIIATDESIVEQPGDNHTFRNEGKRDVILYGQSFRPEHTDLATPRDRPVHCQE